MNPMTNIKNTQKISEREIELGTAGTGSSWHQRYKDSAWIFIGGLPYDLTEGDVICVFSQCGEIVNCNMVRDQKSGKSKGFMFLCYEDQRSTILAVDNLNGIKILNRTIRVDHVLDYKPPKDHENDHEMTKMLKSEGCAPKAISESESEDELDILDPLAQMKKEKKVKKKKKEKKKKKHKSRSDSEDEAPSRRIKHEEVTVKKEKIDPGYRDMDNRHGNHGDDGRHGNSSRRHMDDDRDSRYERSKNGDRHRDESRGDGRRDESRGDGRRDESRGDGRRDDGHFRAGRDDRESRRDDRDREPRGNRDRERRNDRDRARRDDQSQRSRERDRSPKRRSRSRSPVRRRSRTPDRRDKRR